VSGKRRRTETAKHQTHGELGEGKKKKERKADVDHDQTTWNVRRAYG